MARICFIATNQWLPWGGSEVLWSQTAERMARDGHDVLASVPASQTGGKHLDRIRAAGGRTDVRPDSRRLSRAERLRARLDRYLNRPPRDGAAAVFGGVPFDLILVSQAGSYDGAAWAERCRDHGVPYAVIVQAASEHLQPKDDELPGVVRAFEGAAALLFVSEGNLRLVRQQLASPLPRGEIVRNPVQVDRDATPPPWPEGDRVRLACVARLETCAKGQDLILDVMARRKWRERPVDVTLFGGGVNKDLLAKLIAQRGLTNVRLGGSVADVRSIWASHHGLLLPSRYEGLPLALVEAMLCGRVPVVTDVAGNPELVEEPRTGFLAAAATADLVDAALERAWAAREQWPQIGGAARAAALLATPADAAAALAARLTALTSA